MDIYIDLVFFTVYAVWLVMFIYDYMEFRKFALQPLMIALLVFQLIIKLILLNSLM